MTRPRSLAALLLAGCPWPAGLPEVAPPGRTPGGVVVYPDLRAEAGPRDRARRDAVVIVSVEEYVGMADRPGAHAMAAAWYRHFREARGVWPWRIKLLRDAEATPSAISRALGDARWWVHHDNTLWFVFIGHISGAPGRYGELWLHAGDGTEATRDGGTFAISDVLGRIDSGRHPRAVAVLDGCMPPGLLPAGSETPGLPQRAIPATTGWVSRPVGANNAWQDNVAQAMTETAAQVGRDKDRSRNTPSDLVVLGAGAGAGCVEHLPGTRFPALSYLVLGGLRGWADRDGDAAVTAVEALTGAHTQLHTLLPGNPARPSVFAADIVLARNAIERAPVLMPPRRPDEAAPPMPAPQILLDDMVRFEEGAFRMGCPARRDRDCEADERPGRVVLSSFHLDPYEVTVADYAECIERGACTPIREADCYVWQGGEFVLGGKLPPALLQPEHPIMCVTWQQAANYCDAVGKQLPTEAEWERAAAGATRRRFPWGDEAPTCARAHHDGCGEHTRPVGTHPAGATPEGVHDLAGNVGEWVHDWYARKIHNTLRFRDPTGADGGDVRVVRGGSFYEGAINLRAAYRYGLTPTYGYSTVGFRCSR